MFGGYRMGNLSLAFGSGLITPTPFAVLRQRLRPRRLPCSFLPDALLFDSPLGSLAGITNVGNVCSVGSELIRSPTPGSAELENLSDYYRVCEAAEYLGASPNSLRNWVNAGKILAVRHPVNDYRLFKRADLEAFLKQVAVAHKKAAK